MPIDPILTDSFFYQGSSHEVCQDYALIAPEHYGILSDGCSGALNSDWGARLLCKGAEKYLHRLMAPDDCQKVRFIVEAHSEARKWALCMPNLSKECVTATLGTLYRERSVVHSLLIGDGVEGGMKHSGEWCFRTIEPAPYGEPPKAGCFYPIYLTSRTEEDAYFQRFGGQHKIVKYSGDLFGEAPMRQEEEVITLDRQRPFFDSSYSREEYKFVFLATDGLMSFAKKIVSDTQKVVEPVGILDVMRVLFDNIQHRMNFLVVNAHWAFKKQTAGTFLGNGWHNKDDVSVIAFHMTEPEQS